MEEGLTPEIIGTYILSTITEEDQKVIDSLYRQNKSIEAISRDTHFTPEKVKKILEKLMEKDLVGKRKK